MRIHFIAACLILISPVGFSQDTLLYPSLPPGMKSPEIKGENEHGKSFRLSKVKSRLTLIYFYEVHCHLCEIITPALKKLYESYHDLGLEMIAIPVESRREEWLNYISEHGLNWKNIFLSEKSRGRVKTDYLITVSPTIYLLDKNKILLTRRLGRIEQVEEELNRRIR